jgi:hypothetical protein
MFRFFANRLKLLQEINREPSIFLLKIAIEKKDNSKCKHLVEALVVE